ncbi:predicted protein [Nematostella vectensis]|uniref:E1 ubiquitin-activating enzyme n=1 Tax=Nematostella vectensis TaxID=45351 RepID=A7SBV9_NEMVE|nr:predicted protein [Nematostella vectensis]|eukprot:XP_001630838.1 predicted protein [Nematostella vectensis]
MLGDQAMQKMAHASVFLSGVGGLGVEIAKNLTLAGIKSITLHDTRAASMADLGSQFFLREDDVTSSRNRAVASAGRVAELNPYVSVHTQTDALDENNLDVLKNYQCVILTDAPLSVQLKVNSYCRSQKPQKQFISTSLYGIFGCLFCDFGNEFEVLDTTGEEPKEFFIGKITKDNPGVVTTLDNTLHGLETGDTITCKEIVGMEKLNNTQCTVSRVLSPYAFTISDTTGDEYGPYKHGGIARQVRPSSTILKFESLERQLEKPDILTADLCKMELPVQLHLGFRSLMAFQQKNGHLPNVRNEQDAAEVLRIATELNSQTENKVDVISSDVIRKMSFVGRGYFAPLSAAMGGIAAQEVLKALTGKYMPIRQWLYLDCIELLPYQENVSPTSFSPRCDRYDALRVCIGDELVRRIADLKLFMVGCGAIGCEFLKNFALLGIASGNNGLISITDNDLIEKSNLNRQFLFRPHHIQKAKSTTSATSTKEINPSLHIEAHQQKVCPDTEQDTFNDAFFESQEVVVNALDNVEARRYVDSRCVSNQRALLETGTMGAKGHVQVIVPHLTESYTSQRDPVDQEVPYCTLKSFPAIIEHCIQWARDKFESSFTQKAGLFKKFWGTHQSPQELLQKLETGTEVDGLGQVLGMMRRRPVTWGECVALARVKFEKYFNHKAKQLIHAFPVDTRLKDGSLFWQSPKRPPTPQVFNPDNDIDLLFVSTAARLYADVYGITVTEQDMSQQAILPLVQTAKVPEFVPSNKTIETDETANPKEKNLKTSHGEDDLQACREDLTRIIADEPTGSYGHVTFLSLGIYPLEFEKDDDRNGHIDFITAAANLRARMYSIETADRLKVKRIAGKIIPAIATTTAAVAGLVRATIELVKIVMGRPRDDYRNGFMNLALPYVIFSEPGPAATTVIRPGLTFTIWDRWIVKGNKNFKLKDFNQCIKDQYGLQVTMVVQGVKMIYVPVVPGHAKRLDHKMTKLLKLSPSQTYTDLTVSFAGPNADEEDLPGPPVRYYV